MWVHNRDGFFSAVQHRERKDIIIVRARCQQHIDHLVEKINERIEHFIEEAPVGVRPTFTPDADYAWRIEVTKQQWAHYLFETANDIDYDNVKANIDGGDEDYHRAMMRCWSAMNDFQGEREGVGMYANKTLSPRRS